MIGVEDDQDDRGLLVRACDGNEPAFGRLVERHRCGLELYCYLMLGDHEAARRAMGDIVLTAWRERELVTPQMKLRIWLYRIATRFCIDAGDGVE
jgi:RNA polymerase sigma-70 factor (ECF subfamily)